MRRRALGHLCASCRHTSHLISGPSNSARRYVQINAIPSSAEPQQSLDPRDSPNNTSADARFEVIGNTSSLLSASLSPSQNLYTRKGTLVGFNGTPEDATSSLSLLGPFRRALFGIPFIYQRVTATTPYTALIGTKSPITSLVVVHLDGRLDWMIAQRNALLAWTGQNLSLAPRLNTKMSLSHWGNTLVSGRGLLALSGKGLVHQITLKTGDQYVVHPSNVVAYSVMQNAPQPYRFRANVLRFQIPNPLTWLPDTRFWRTMRETAVWRYTRDALLVLRTWARRTIWGDRLFLHFRGPTTILIQSRSSSIREVLTSRDVNEIADGPAGAVAKALTPGTSSLSNSTTAQSSTRETKVHYASVDGRGTVKFDDVKP